MGTNSETESDTESFINCTPHGRPPGCMLISLDGSCLPLHADIFSAITFIKQTVFSEINDSYYHQGVAASNCIIKFLNYACAFPPVNDSSARILTLFPHLVDIDFLNALFIHRQTFFDKGGSSASFNVPLSATIISWVDIVLAKLGDFILIVASGLRHQFCNTTPAYLQTQREEDSISAATQLPRKWQLLADTLVSNHISPACKRLALRLLFAAYVMAPQFDRQFSHKNNIQPQQVLDSMLFSDRGIFNGFRATAEMSYCNEQDRVNFAMIVCLFAGQPAETQPAMRPLASNYLSNMIRFVLNERLSSLTSQDTIPLLELDIPQVIFLHWGNVVPWCWSLWKGPEDAIAESIVQSTMTWLYHIDRPFWPQGIDTFNDITAFSSLIFHLSKNRTSSCSVLLQILHQIATMLQDTSNTERPVIFHTLQKVLSRTCWVTTQLFIMSTQDVESEIQRHQRDFCHCLLSLFCVLNMDEEELQIKDLVLEALSFIQPSALRVCLGQSEESSNLKLSLLINEVIAKTTSLYETPGLNCDHLALRSIVSLLTIIWHAGTRNRRFQGIGPLLKIMVTILHTYPIESQISSLCCDTLLTALSVLDAGEASNGCLSRIQEENVWTLAMRIGPSNLTIASGFAHRLLATDHKVDVVCQAEALNYIRDILFLVLDRRFQEQEESLALLICPVLCLSLIKLMQNRVCTEIGQCLSSPWTTRLRAQLCAIDKHGCSGIPYFKILHHKLGCLVKILVDQIDAQKSKSDSYKLIPDFTTQLLFCYSYPNSRLILFSQITSE
ncbi:hypothetical protein BDZ94DRAFT_1276108 [Collybia nuda]|uniref:Uncharacterized protein n=1 Tax=Collybia nuda TaxID=64659 RepID=A0A9P5XRC6_9AGAR|nr:hypothetical protein BDZ94DRAFT_1276108 [Collybia nuda]